MFRKKDPEPSRPSAGLAEKPGDGGPVRPIDPLQARPGGGGGGEPRPSLTPELPRRQIDIPPSPATAHLSPVDRDRAAAAAAAAAQADSGKRLIVGPGISLSGEITACDRLVVQGSVQVTLNETRAIEIAESGRFTNGKAEVEEAEISGVYEGDLTVRNRLLIRSTGRVQGNVRYGEIEVERGGRVSGSVSMLESGT